MTQLAIEQLYKTYRSGNATAVTHAVRDINLSVKSGELISLLGPSGCGKTSTLRCIAGFETPDSGAIRFDNADIVPLAPEERDIGLVFQNYALFPHMTVAQNVAFGLEMRKISSADIKRRVADVLETVQLAGLKDRYPAQLSGGQQQRVALARALVIEPRILLLDEPLANLDAKLRDEMRFFIRSLQQRTGITTLYVTHDQSEAMVMSDRIVVMFDGEVRQFDVPSEIYNRPATRRIAEFVGLSSFVAGEVVERDGETGRVVDTSIGRLRGFCKTGCPPGQRVLIVLRPEAIHLSLTEPAPETTPIHATVQERHFLGHTVDYRLVCADGTVLQAHQNTLMDVPVGASVWCTFPQDRMWIFPAPVGEASA
ncbi:ABC transporter ATP-binding protein [Acuticoccus kandeliae]|uniref:ABC transporter ATP-binding protein n=1 Tax=Acuticoccus kandeliae TaxID=2073160 RepID=UPI001B3BE923|nr:ABC transporter ATP-binding protein [Acuticoccus kandeliae]